MHLTKGRQVISRAVGWEENEKTIKTSVVMPD